MKRASGGEFVGRTGKCHGKIACMTRSIKSTILSLGSTHITLLLGIYLRGSDKNLCTDDNYTVCEGGKIARVRGANSGQLE